MEGKIFYVTKEKLKYLQKEYDDLVVLEHQKLSTQEAPRMLESEDINPEFVSYQEEVTSMRDRIEELKDILEHHQIIKNPPKTEQDAVGVGATVKIDVGGQKAEFMITGTLEADPVVGKISNESPVGKALLGHKIGDEVLVDSPEKTKYKIRDIKYEVS